MKGGDRIDIKWLSDVHKADRSSGAQYAGKMYQQHADVALTGLLTRSTSQVPKASAAGCIAGLPTMWGSESKLPVKERFGKFEVVEASKGDTIGVC